MSGAQTVHAAMSDARIAQAEERAKAILAEMAHTRTRCDDCGVVSPRLDDRGLHDGCAAGDWPRPPMRDWTKLEGIEGLREIANMMIDLVGDVRRSRELAASYDMDHALRDAAEQAELLQHGAERARDEARAEAHRLSARLIAAERERSEDAESTRAAWRESGRREQELRDRLIAAERERDDLAATLETRNAEHALAMTQVREMEAERDAWRRNAESGAVSLADLKVLGEGAALVARGVRAEVRHLRAIIAGRTTPPTDAELAAHGNGRGLWIFCAVSRHPEIVYGERARSYAGSSSAWYGGARWIALGDEGRPCAWPTAAEGAR